MWTKYIYVYVIWSCVSIDVDWKVQIFIVFSNTMTTLFRKSPYGIFLCGFSRSPFNCKDMCCYRCGQKSSDFCIFFLNTIITLFDAVYPCNICMVSYYVVSQAVLLIARILTHCPCSRILSRVSLFLRWFEWIGENSH